MSEPRPVVPPAMSWRPVGGDMALLTAIDQALDAPKGELPGRVALVRGYLRYVLEALPRTNRNASFQVIAGMIARDTDPEQSAPRATGPSGATGG
jgi:hypothetical protein